MLSFLLLSLLVLGSPSAASPTLICCGGDEVFIISLDDEQSGVKDRLWSWQASDSPAIHANARGWFRSTDECKPLAHSILITSSSGGVALISRKDKRCL